MIGSEKTQSVREQSAAKDYGLLRTPAERDGASQIASCDQDRRIIGTENSLTIDEQSGENLFCLAIATGFGQCPAEKPSPDQDLITLGSLQGRPFFDQRPADPGAFFGTALGNFSLSCDGKFTEVIGQFVVASPGTKHQSSNCAPQLGHSFQSSLPMYSPHSGHSPSSGIVISFFRLHPQHILRMRDGSGEALVQQRLNVTLRRIVRKWIDDPDRRSGVDRRLRALGVGIDAGHLLDEVADRSNLAALRDADSRTATEILDRYLEDTLKRLTTALESNPVVKVRIRRFDHQRIGLGDGGDGDGEDEETPVVGNQPSGDGEPLSDDDSDSDEDSLVEDLPEMMIDAAVRDSSRRLETSPGLWRSVVEAHGLRIGKGNIQSVSAMINWINVQGDSTGSGRVHGEKLPRKPWPKRLPWPKAGVVWEQALMWPALWLSGETGLFPRENGADPSQKRRIRRIRELQRQRDLLESVAREMLDQDEGTDRE